MSERHIMRPNEFKPPFKHDIHTGTIRCQSTKGGEAPALDIRGFGYLTGGGYGAHGYSEDKAVEIQDRFGKWVETALNSYTAMLEALGKFPDECDYPNSEVFRGECNRWWETYARPALAQARGEESGL